MTITNEIILQADYEVVESWRGRDGANEEGSHRTTKVIIPKQFMDDVNALCDYAGLSELATGMTITMSLQETLSVMPRKRARIDSYKQLVRFLNDEMGVTLTLYSNKIKKDEKEIL